MSSRVKAKQAGSRMIMPLGEPMRRELNLTPLSFPEPTDCYVLPITCPKSKWQVALDIASSQPTSLTCCLSLLCAWCSTYPEPPAGPQTNHTCPTPGPLQVLCPLPNIPWLLHVADLSSFRSQVTHPLPREVPPDHSITPWIPYSISYHPGSTQSSSLSRIVVFVYLLMYSLLISPH